MDDSRNQSGSIPSADITLHQGKDGTDTGDSSSLQGEKTKQKDKTLPVIELFGPTIQGEGPLCGSKTMFVRFGGCDYRCKMCDSMHAVEPQAIKKHAKRLSAQDIADALIEKAVTTGTPWVTLSGGNPCMHDLNYLISLLHGAGLAVALETQGTLSPDWIKRCQMVVVCPKGQGMGEKFEEDKFLAFMNKLRTKEGIAGTAVALKIVVFSQHDIDFGLQLEQLILRQAPGIIAPGMVFMSLGNASPPILDADLNLVSDIREGSHIQNLLSDYRALIDDFLVDERVKHWRFLPQLHVLLYSNEASR